MKKLNPSRVGAIAVTAALTVGLVAGPASAKGPTLKSLSKTLTSLQKTVKAVQKNVAAATKAANTANTGLAATNTALKSTNSALQTLQTAGGQAITAFTALATAVQTQIVPGLTALTAAVQNASTGLPGLNNARPLVGAVVSNAAAPGSEFTVTNPATGEYILSFVNGHGAPTAVDTRSVMIQPLAADDNDTTTQSVNCAAAGNPCTVADTANTDELVLTFATGTATDENFQVAAISG